MSLQVLPPKFYLTYTRVCYYIMIISLEASENTHRYTCNFLSMNGKLQVSGLILAVDQALCNPPVKSGILALSPIGRQKIDPWFMIIINDYLETIMLCFVSYVIIEIIFNLPVNIRFVDGSCWFHLDRELFNASDIHLVLVTAVASTNLANLTSNQLI